MSSDPWWHEGASPEGPGSAAQEAGKLFDALRERFAGDAGAAQAGMMLMHGLETLRGFVGGPIENAETTQPGEAPECAYCPFCQFIRHTKDLDAESVERMAAAAMEFAESLRPASGTSDSTTQTDDSELRHVTLDDDDPPSGQ